MNKITDTKELEKIATQVRRDIMRMVHAVQSGHPGGSLGCADFFTALYFNILNHTPKPFNMHGKEEDVFILSNGHISPVFYSALARSGYFEVSELSTFRKLNTRLQGHPATHEGLEGVRVATGSLGQGMSVAIGVALAKKLNNDPSLVFSLHGDGELQEGQNWEALMFAPNHKVDNLIVTIDYNGQQIDGRTSDVMPLGDLHAKLRSFGWHVIDMNGNDMKNVVETLETVRTLAHRGESIAIVMRTKMGMGVDFMEDDHRWHGTSPNDEQLKNALSQLEETLGDY